jgi:hypothetical protein
LKHPWQRRKAYFLLKKKVSLEIKEN